ncbi:MAG: hypothetical protein II840_11645 [Kiritimatiellae bacterium]|nr:hypothetical protein [Kiritimatiellia bacterium]
MAAIIATAQQMNSVSNGFMTAVLSGVAGIIAAVGGAAWGRHGVNEKLAKQEKELRTSIANELRTSIVNDPLNVSPSFAEQNRKEHAELYEMVRKHEAQIARLVEHDISLDKTLDRMATQLDKLYDKIIGGKKK